MSLTDYQLQIGSLVLGPSTNYTIHKVDGFGLPAVRSTDVNRPRDHGDFYSLDFIGQRVVTIDLTVRGTSDANVVANLDTLMATWQPVSTDATTTDALSIKLPGQSARQIKGRPRRAVADTSRIIGNRIPVTLEFKAADPRVYADTASSGSVGLLQATSGRSYNRVYPLSYGGGSSANLSAVNAGNFATRPVATILGPAVNPVVQNVTTGQWVKFLTTLTGSDTLVVDFDARTVILNGSASRYSTMTSDSQWWELAPGTSQIVFSADAYQAAALLTLAWRSAWL